MKHRVFMTAWWSACLLFNGFLFYFHPDLFDGALTGVSAAMLFRSIYRLRKLNERKP
jgi:hypothetical protein